MENMSTLRLKLESISTNKLLLFLIAIVAVILIGWSLVETQERTMKDEIVQVQGGTYRNIDSEQLWTMLQKKDFVLINVHIPYEGELPQTDLFIAYNAIDRNIEKLPQNKSETVVLYCMSGRMSAIASETMVGLGYTNVWNLEEGMREWQQKGYSLLIRP